MDSSHNMNSCDGSEDIMRKRWIPLPSTTVPRPGREEEAQSGLCHICCFLEFLHVWNRHQRQRTLEPWPRLLQCRFYWRGEDWLGSLVQHAARYSPIGQSDENKRRWRQETSVMVALRWPEKTRWNWRRNALVMYPRIEGKVENSPLQSGCGSRSKQRRCRRDESAAWGMKLQSNVASFTDV